MDWNVILRAGMAGQFEDEIRIWEKDHFVVIAQQFDGKIDRSSVIYGSAARDGAAASADQVHPPGRDARSVESSAPRCSARSSDASLEMSATRFMRRSSWASSASRLLRITGSSVMTMTWSKKVSTSLRTPASARSASV